MNASPRNETDPRAMIAAVVALHGDQCADDGMTNYAVAAFEAGRAAFYSTASYHNQRALCLCDTANMTGDLLGAMRSEYRYRDDARASGLNALVPLNDEAMSALIAAYSAIGVWRDAYELEARRFGKAVAA